MVKNNRSILVQDNPISISTINEQDYISLTDMLKAKDGDFFITDWLRNRNTLEFIGIWEQINNPNFNYGEFAIIKNQAGFPHCQNSCHPHPNNLNGGKGDNHGTIQCRTQTSNIKQTAIA